LPDIYTPIDKIWGKEERSEKMASPRTDTPRNPTLRQQARWDAVQAQKIVVSHYGQ